MIGWARRTRELHDELAELASDDPRWWLLAGAAAVTESWPARPGYVVSGGDPDADTFIGARVAPPADPIADAILRARAAATAIRALDGRLPEQPLAVALDGGHRVPASLEVAAFAIGAQCLVGSLADPQLPAQLAALARGESPDHWTGPPPFVCVSLGDEPIATARHGHRRAWRDPASASRGSGPWLGLGRTGELSVVSTCHMIVDGYGHAWLASLIHRELAALAAAPGPRATPVTLPPLAPVADASPLGVAWRPISGEAPRALPLAYALGCLLHREAGSRAAPFSPTLQIPVAPGLPSDPTRRLRRVMPAAVSVRFEGGEPEPFARFAARARATLERETAGNGLCARLVAAARAAPAPLAWKRRHFAATRSPWLDRVSGGIADVLGGRACVSRIRLDLPSPPSCAVSSPARLASETDPLGACVATVIDDGVEAALTICGSGLVAREGSASAILDELLTNISSCSPPIFDRVAE
ncbi:MAG TPA: hypothetical protein VGM88_29175 [Kofleriaceae bacterium]